MTQIVEHCTSGQQVGQLTPSDVPLVRSPTLLLEITKRKLPELGIPVVDVDDMYPATPLQYGFIGAMLKDPSEYTVQVVFDIVKSDLDVERLKKAWERVSTQHPILRTVFVPTSEGVFQVVKKRVNTHWNTSLTMAPSTVGASLATFLQEDRKRGFRLDDECMVRFTLIGLEGAFKLVWTFHHSIMDGWSMPLVIGDLVRQYNGKNAVSAGPSSFRDYVVFSEKVGESESEAFWSDVLRNTLGAGTLALRRPVTVADEMFSSIRYTSSASPTAVAEFCRRERITHNILAKAIWALVMKHYTRKDVVVFGSVTSGRDIDLRGVERYCSFVTFEIVLAIHSLSKHFVFSRRIVGVLINTIPNPVAAHDDRTFGDILKELQEFHVTSLPHSHCRLSDVQKWAGVASGEALFETILVFQNFEDPTENGSRNLTRSGNDELELEVALAREDVEYPLGLLFNVSSERFAANIKFRTDSFEKEQVERIMSHFDTVLKDILHHGPSVTVGTLNTLRSGELEVVQKFEFGGEIPVPFSLLHSAFEQRSLEQPSAVAIEHREQSISYEQLDELSNAVANHLRSCGVTSGAIVPIVISRSIEMVIAILAVLKSGAAYAPVDPAWPRDRAEYVLHETRAPVVLTATADMDFVPKATRVPLVIVNDIVANLERSAPRDVLKPAEQATANSVAYVIFTSGKLLIEHFVELQPLMTHDIWSSTVALR
ncbi:hypothetical protein HK102_008307 [Quaeritorhiza haematococci]|nr:hypothetical protein HK102_008307 [Quaeritorhiza haematococci]